MTLGATWIDVASAGISPVSNGNDAFLITAGVNLPIYRKRLDSAVRSAEAKAVSTARAYDSLRDTTLEEVMDLFVKAQSQQDLLVLFREDILPPSRLTLEVSNRAYGMLTISTLDPKRPNTVGDGEAEHFIAPAVAALHVMGLL